MSMNSEAMVQEELRHLEALRQLDTEAAYKDVMPGTAGQAHLGKAVPKQYPHDMTTSPGPEPFTLANIDAAMTYQPWGPLETEAGEIVRESLTLAAKAILRHVPAGAFRSVALRAIIDARMNANAGISFRGRF